MIWNRVDGLHWTCEDYKENYAIEVKPYGKRHSWTVFFKDKKVKSGRATHPLDAMAQGCLFVDGYSKEEHGSKSKTKSVDKENNVLQDNITL